MSLLRKLSAQKTKEVSLFEKKFYGITCIAGGAVALLAMIIGLITVRGTYASYNWACVLLGLGSAIFYALAILRYMWPNNPLVARVADASVFLTVFCAYAPLQLIITRPALYENGSIVTGWLTFGLVGFFSFCCFLVSVIATSKFRLFNSFLYILMAVSIFFCLPAMLVECASASVLVIIAVTLMALAFAATPIIFWFFDRYNWQMKVFYILMASGTLIASLITVLYLFIRYC